MFELRRSAVDAQKGAAPMTSLRTSGGRLATILVLLLLTSVALIACGGEAEVGGEAEADEFRKITPSDRVYAIEDLQAMGFKKSKTYNVEELPEAVSAYFGFWGLDAYDRFDYEVRFYESHEAAVEHGTWWADVRVGEDALIKEEDAPWKVGYKDARSCKGDLASGPASHGIQACTSPKYFEYAIYGNMILMCQGQDQVEGAENCKLVLDRVE